MKKNIPIFYACDENFAKYTLVSITSLMDNANKDYFYHIHILNSGLPMKSQEMLRDVECENVEISFVDVSEYIETIKKKLPLRDYYDLSTYYRLFISTMFPELDKIIYIDSDTIVMGDIQKLYSVEMGDNYISASHDLVMEQTEVFGEYVEKVLGINRYEYFNAGVIVINSKAFRQKDILNKFIKLLGEYRFVVTQDQDYLNVLCKDNVFWISQEWNAETCCRISCDDSEIKILHYIMAEKPWNYKECKYSEFFWKYAKRTKVISEIEACLDGYDNHEQDKIASNRLVETAINEINRDDGYFKLLQKKQNQDRVEILSKIKKLENKGIFDQDVEIDPPSKELFPNEIEYVNKTMVEKLKTKIAFNFANRLINKLIKDEKMIIKDIVGVENFLELNSGAVVTCNHFNAFDSFAISRTYDMANLKNRKFYRVIREGNYTSFQGFYGFLMRNCNTLPLSSNLQTMRKFVKGVDEILNNGHLVLFYPEESMWWNYRKPKPLKNGAYHFASKNSVPVLPCFITMKDSGIIGDDGFNIQEYTIHIGKKICPQENKTKKENLQYMKDRNFEVWKNIYEKEYGIPLRYDNDESESRMA